MKSLNRSKTKLQIDLQVSYFQDLIYTQTVDVATHLINVNGLGRYTVNYKKYFIHFL